MLRALRLGLCDTKVQNAVLRVQVQVGHMVEGTGPQSFDTEDTETKPEDTEGFAIVRVRSCLCELWLGLCVLCDKDWKIENPLRLRLRRARSFVVGLNG